MPDQYIEIPVETDPSALVQAFFDAVQARYPDWQPEDGDVEVIMQEVWSSQIADVGDLVTQVARSIFRYFGANLAGIPPIDASPATGSTNWTVRDSAGYTVPAGALVGIPGAGGQNDLIPFATENATIIPAGATVANGVQITAVVPGASGEGLSGTPELITALDFVSSIALPAPTTGGVDAEDDDTYLTRLKAQLALQAPRPILPRDFATMYQSLPSVWRATYIDLYIPGSPPVTDAPRAIYLVGMDSAGSALDSSVKAAGLALLQGERETNFVVNIGDPHYVAIDVTYTAVAWPDFDPSAIRDGINSALGALLSPLHWGAAVGVGNRPSWYNTPTLHYNDLVAICYQTPGVRNLTDLQVAIHGGTLGRTDIDLTSSGTYPVPVPTVGTIAATVNTSV